MLKYIRKKLASQLAANVIILVALILLIMGILISTYMISSTEAELTLRLEAESSLAVHKVEALFENSALRAKQLSLDITVQEYLKDVKTREDIESHPYFPHVLNMLKAIAQSDEHTFLASVANEAANFYIDNLGTVPSEDYKVNIRPWYSVALSGKGIIYTEPYIEWLTKKYVVSTLYALFEGDVNYGFIIIDFQLDSIPDVVSNISVGEKGQVIITDSSGRFIYHKNSEWVLNENIQDKMPELFNYLISNNSFNKFDTMKSDNQKHYVLSRNIKNTDWTMILLVDRSEVLDGLNHFLMNLTLIIFLLASLSTFVIFKIIKQKLKPIEALKIYGNSIASGNLDDTPPYIYTSREDEMGDLSRAFVTITEVFRQQNSKLEDIVFSQYQELQNQYKYIIEKEKIASLGVLVAGVAHEINTPLGTSITSASYIDDVVTRLISLYEAKELSETDFIQSLTDLKKSSELLNSNLNRSLKLVRQFKTIATNQNTERITSFNLANEIQHVIDSLAPVLRRNNTSVQLLLNDDIEMSSYQGALTQIFTNLIMNSLHHAFTNIQGGEISIKAHVDGNLIRISYKDNGKGLDTETMQHIFEPFYTTRSSEENSGLGMFIVHNLITQTLSGTIHCESKSGHGILFTITLPKILN